MGAASLQQPACIASHRVAAHRSASGTGGYPSGCDVCPSAGDQWQSPAHLLSFSHGPGCRGDAWAAGPSASGGRDWEPSIWLGFDHRCISAHKPAIKFITPAIKSIKGPGWLTPVLIAGPGARACSSQSTHPCRRLPLLSSPTAAVCMRNGAISTRGLRRSLHLDIPQSRSCHVPIRLGAWRLEAIARHHTIHQSYSVYLTYLGT